MHHIADHAAIDQVADQQALGVLVGETVVLPALVDGMRRHHPRAQVGAADLRVAGGALEPGQIVLGHIAQANALSSEHGHASNNEEARRRPGLGASVPRQK